MLGLTFADLKGTYPANSMDNYANKLAGVHQKRGIANRLRELEKQLR